MTTYQPQPNQQYAADPQHYPDASHDSGGSQKRRRLPRLTLFGRRQKRTGRLAALKQSASTRPGKIRVLTALALLAALVTFSSGTLSVVIAHRGLDTIGEDAGPQVVATADLYFALSDMDTQVASVLLMGNDHDLGIGREKAIERYEERREQANRALVEATDLAGNDEIARDMIRSVLNGLGEYERLASQAMLESKRADHEPGETPDQVLDRYRQAHDIMKFQLLPKAYNLTLENGTIVRRTNESTSENIAMLRIVFVTGGVLLVATLIVGQVFLSMRFRRMLNPALLAATLGAFVVVLAGTFLLTKADSALATAKRDGFDSVLAMSRARAISNSMQADQSRYLLDRGQRDTYEQTYLAKSQTVLYKDSANLDIYRNAVELSVEAFRDDEKRTSTPFLGFFGDEVTSITIEGQRAALERALQRYKAYQDQDGEMRGYAEGGHIQTAIGVRMDEVDKAFRSYDQALQDLISLHKEAFDSSISDGRSAVSGWQFVLPATAGVIALLIWLGMRPRLAEYR